MFLQLSLYMIKKDAFNSLLTFIKFLNYIFHLMKYFPLIIYYHLIEL